MFEAMQTQAGMGKRASPATGESPPSGGPPATGNPPRTALAEEMVSAQRRSATAGRCASTCCPSGPSSPTGSILPPRQRARSSAQTASITTGRRPTTKALRCRRSRPGSDTFDRPGSTSASRRTPREPGAAAGRSIALPEEIEFPEVDEADEAD